MMVGDCRIKMPTQWQQEAEERNQAGLSATKQALSQHGTYPPLCIRPMVDIDLLWGVQWGVGEIASVRECGCASSRCWCCSSSTDAPINTRG